MNLYFSVLGKLVFHFFVTHEIFINVHVICEPKIFGGIKKIDFFEYLASLKLVNYTKRLDVKLSCLFNTPELERKNKDTPAQTPSAVLWLRRIIKASNYCHGF